MDKVSMPAVSYEENYSAWLAYWRYNSSRRFLTPPEDKGTPVPHTGVRRVSSGKDSGKGGVSGGSRVLPHRYMSEGDAGPQHRREVRRKERRMVADEINEGFRDWLYEGADYDPLDWMD